METFIEARKSGQVRHLGFSAHSVKAALAALDRFEFDSILFPVNFATYEKGAFGPQIMEAARAKGVARLALKAMARQNWPEGSDEERKKYPKCWYQPLTDPHEAELALRFTLSQPLFETGDGGRSILRNRELRLVRFFPCQFQGEALFA